jgi:K+-transporting ATPase ATPase C chain
MVKNVISQFRLAVVALALFTLITGVFYPLVVTGIAQIAFPHQANGSLIVQNGQAIGSELIGQPFDDPRYFWSRPSATSPFPYNGAASSGSNLGPDNPALLEAVKARIEALKAADPENPLPVPVDLVTASGSGLDPDISVAAALYQVSRIAKARGMSEDAVRALVESHIKEPQLSDLGEPRVNVLELNLALDKLP